MILAILMIFFEFDVFTGRFLTRFYEINVLLMAKKDGYRDINLKIYPLGR